MKRLIAFLIILTLSFALLAGCAPSGEAETTDEPETTGKVIESEGQYSISLPICEQTVKMHKSYEKFLPYITDDLIDSADLALSKVLTEDKNSGIYLTTDLDGYLCLCLEVIVYLEPDDPEYPGCCIDHDHTYYRERISTEPLK